MEEKKHILKKIRDHLKTDDLLWENEVRGNILVAKVMLLDALILLVSWILNLAHIFDIEASVMNAISFQGLLELVIPALICFGLKGEKKWMKYLLLIEFTIVLARLDSVLSFNVVLGMIMPVILSCLYYTRGFTVMIAVLTTILFAVSAYCGAALGLAKPDMNFAVADTAVYTRTIMLQSFFPKWMTFAVISFICAKIAVKGRKMVYDQDRISQEHSRVETELNMASAIQTRALPIVHTLPKQEKPLFDLAARMIPAKEVGGDFYDFFYLDPTHLALIVADVSGKGVPAALFMMISKLLLDNSIATGKTPGQVLAEVNHQLCEKNLEDMFVTVWLGIIDLETGNMVTANAGHEYPIISRQGGAFEVVKDKHGLVLGGIDGSRYKEMELQLVPGDILFVYTDGVPEANDAENKLFGMERTLASLNSHRHDDMEELVEHMKADIDAFAAGTAQFDDTTMLAFHFIDYVQTKGLRQKPEMESIQKAADYVSEKMEKAEVPMKIATKINIAVDEIYSNIVRYSTAGWAEVICTTTDGEVMVRFIDNGIPYDPTKAEDPDISASAEDRQIGGLGIFMVRNLMDEMTYEHYDGVNVTTIRKKF